MRKQNTWFEKITRFNSRKVRLKRVSAVSGLANAIGFQFHEGPIKTLIFALPLFNVPCFNSMKVRLKRSKALRET